MAAPTASIKDKLLLIASPYENSILMDIGSYFRSNFEVLFIVIVLKLKFENNFVTSMEGEYWKDRAGDGTT
jgi:hypothetical protein